MNEFWKRFNKLRLERKANSPQQGVRLCCEAAQFHTNVAERIRGTWYSGSDLLEFTRDYLNYRSWGSSPTLASKYAYAGISNEVTPREGKELIEAINS